MFIPITYRVKYKEYKYAPKATNASRSLGTLCTWPAVLFMAGLWFCVIFFAMTAILGSASSVPVIVAAASLVPAGFLFANWRKRREARIDEDAKAESARVFAMTAEERTQYEAQLVKEGRRRSLWVILGIILLFGMFSALLKLVK